MRDLGVLYSTDDFDVVSVDDAVRDRYTGVALRGKNASQEDVASSGCCGPSGDCCGGSGSESAEARSIYSGDQLSSVPVEAAVASAGCGNPIGLSEARTGETVLDLGSGGGIDCFLAAEAVGEAGMVIGVDMTPAMIELARGNAERLGVDNVVFKLGRIEALPELDDTVDLVISNCVISLVVNKDLAFEEIYRVLKPGGRFVISDMVVIEDLPESVRMSAEEWVSCVGGADVLDRYMDRIERAGFTNVETLSNVGLEAQEGSASWGDSIRSVTVRGWKPE